MTRFAILLGGNLTVTPRLKSQIRGARVIAADSGMMHAAALHLMPELWVGDFDSAGSELTMQYRDVPRETRETVLHSVCARFMTVLGPDADAEPQDNMHVDLACHGKSCVSRLCQ